MYLRNIGAKRNFVTMGVTMAIATEATMGRPIIQPRLASLLESFPRSEMMLFMSGMYVRIFKFGLLTWKAQAQLHRQ